MANHKFYRTQNIMPGGQTLGMGPFKLLFLVLALFLFAITSVYATCYDGRDNDGDGLVDFEDYGCNLPPDNNETGSTECDDGIDNDLDGLVDWPEDTSCLWVGSDSEQNVACNDGLDNDGDGLIDLKDPQCLNPYDSNEEVTSECDDGKDNDLDGAIDWPKDKGCTSETDDGESDDSPRQTDLYERWVNKPRLEQKGYIGGLLKCGESLFDVLKEGGLVSSINEEGNYFVAVRAEQQTPDYFWVTVLSYEQDGSPHELTSLEAALVKSSLGSTKIIPDSINIQRYDEGIYLLRIDRSQLTGFSGDYILDLQAHGSGLMRASVDVDERSSVTILVVMFLGAVVVFSLRKKGLLKRKKRR